MLILGLGLILIGVVVMFIMRARQPEFFRGETVIHESAHAMRRTSIWCPMTRYGAQFGPDFTFLGVPECDLDDESSYADADVVILGAPFDGGTSYRAGTRFGPQAIRMTDYLPHDGSRPSLALRTDGLQDLKVYDAGDVEMYSGDIEVALPALEAAVQKVVQAGAIPVSLGGDHSIAYPDAKGCANVHRRGSGVDDPLRRPRRHRRHRVRLAVGSRAADAPADRVRCAAR